MDFQPNNLASPQENLPPQQDFSGVSPAVPLTMPEKNFGELLRMYRLDYAELSLSEVHERTKLSIGTLQNLENGDFARIDRSPHYIEENIKVLCTLYELDAEETSKVLQAFDAEWQNYANARGYASQPDNLAKAIEDAAPKSHQSISAILISILSIFLVALIIGGYFYRTYQQSRLKGIDTDFDLPSVIEPQRLPLDVIPVPNS